MNAEDYYLKYGVTPMNTKYDKDAKIFDYFTLIDFAEQYAEAKIKALNEPTTESDTSEANLNIPVVGKRIPKTANCSWCNKRHKKEDMIYLEGKAEGNTIDYWLCDKCNFKNDIA